MINILIVDDMPEFKVYSTINYLKSQKLDFKYEICKSCSSGLKYLHTHRNEIDLLILDLGLPFYDSGSDYSPLEGLVFIEEVHRLNLQIPTIVNSTTSIPNEADYEKHFKENNNIFVHVPVLEGDWLYEFIQNNLNK